jgi:hypothetical protein
MHLRFPELDFPSLYSLPLDVASIGSLSADEIRAKMTPDISLHQLGKVWAGLVEEWKEREDLH